MSNPSITLRLCEGPRELPEIFDNFPMMKFLTPERRGDILQTKVSSVAVRYFVQQTKVPLGFLRLLEEPHSSNEKLRHLAVVARINNLLTADQLATIFMACNAEEQLISQQTIVQTTYSLNERPISLTTTFHRPPFTRINDCPLIHAHSLGHRPGKDKHFRFLEEFLFLTKTQAPAFYDRMKDVPLMERDFAVILIPIGGWKSLCHFSPRWHIIASKLNSFNPVKFCKTQPSRLAQRYEQQVYVVPSMSMFRAAFQVKACTNGYRLAPIFRGRLDQTVVASPWTGRHIIRIDYGPEGPGERGADGPFYAGPSIRTLDDIVTASRWAQIKAPHLQAFYRIHTLIQEVQGSDQHEQWAPREKAQLEELRVSIVRGELPGTATAKSLTFGHVFRENFHLWGYKFKRQLLTEIVQQEKHWSETLGVDCTDLHDPELQLFNQIKQALFPTLLEPYPSITRIHQVRPTETESKRRPPDPFDQHTLTRHMTQEQRKAFMAREKDQGLVDFLAGALQETEGLKTILETRYREMDSVVTSLLHAFFQKKITSSQFATLAMMRAAVEQFILKPTALELYYPKVNVGETTSHSFVTALGSIDSKPTVYCFDPLLPDDRSHRILQKYFNLTDREWDSFVYYLSCMPSSEQTFATFPLPLGEGPSLSGMQYALDDVLNVFHPVDERQPYSANLPLGMQPRVYVVPSFSMYQAFLRVSYGTEHAWDLEPILGKITKETIEYYKLRFKRPVGIGLPGAEGPEQADGHYAGRHIFSVHDLYHATRDSLILRNHHEAIHHIIDMLKGCVAELEMGVERTKLTKEQIEALVWKLIDGELMMTNNGLSSACFGDLFSHVHDDHSLAFKQIVIKDMAKMAGYWKDSYQIGRSDLREEDRDLYDSFLKKGDEKKQQPPTTQTKVPTTPTKVLTTPTCCAIL